MGRASAGLGEQLVDAINELSGSHPGKRAAHAKGILCAGTFTASARARTLTRAAHLQGERMAVTVRFSNGSGDPDAPDDDPRDGRGMAVKFYLPGGATTDIVSVSLPVFFARTPDEFIRFTRARKLDPATGEPDMAALGAFLQDHPHVGAALQLILPTLAPPASYATVAYNSLHAFQLVNTAGEGQFVRYRWDPEAGEQTLADDAGERGRDYLQRELRARLDREPVRFRLTATVAADGDSLDDPTQPWPPERERVELGGLELTALDQTRERGDDILVFDPTRVTDGIELSPDPILLARTDAYAASVERRTGVRRAS